MFTWITKKCVESDSGFRVQSLGRYKVQYVQNSEQTISIDRDVGFDTNMNPSVLIREGSFNKWDDGTELTRDEKDKIYSNFVAAMKFQGMGVSIEQESSGSPISQPRIKGVRST